MRREGGGREGGEGGGDIIYTVLYTHQSFKITYVPGVCWK